MTGDGTAAMDAMTDALARAREVFDASEDFTLGIEEEYALLDPEQLDLIPAWDRAHAAALEAGLETAVAGELLASEIEFRTGRCERWSDAVAEMSDIRQRVVRALGDAGLSLGISGTHPWADYREQQIIEQPYYRQLVDRLQYVAHRNNTFGLHVHVGVRGADRAIAVANALRNLQPILLAASASSPFLDGRDCGLASARSLTFSRTFPRGNIAPAWRDFDHYLEYLAFLRDTGSITSIGQCWWGVRPHVLIGTVELRMFDGQPRISDTLAMAAFAQGLVAYLCQRYDDEGGLPECFPDYYVDENLWRAARHGSDALLIDLPTSTERPVADLGAEWVERARIAGQRANLGIDAGLDQMLEIFQHGSSTVRQRAAAAEGGLRRAYELVVAETMSSVESPSAR